MNSISRFQLNKIQNNRKMRYKRQNTARGWISGGGLGHSISYCMKRARNGENVDFYYSQEYSKAHVHGVMTCGSVWDCPVCSAIISRKRSEELRKASKIWAEMGGYMVMVTFTLRHTKKDKLIDMVKVMNEAFRNMKSGRSYQTIKSYFSIIGSITSTEITISNKNGWHYHKHMLLFLDGYRKTDIHELEKDRIKLENYFYEKYGDYVKENGFDISREHGVTASNIMTPERAIAMYLGKWGIEDEMVNGESKDSFTPFDLLDEPENKEYQKLFVEYSKTMKGVSRLQWSRGLRKYLGLQPSKSDEELMEEPEHTDSSIVWECPKQLYLEIVKMGILVQVLENIENGTIYKYLRGKGFFIKYYTRLDAVCNEYYYDPPQELLQFRPNKIK